jgi:Pentapeptide repeats (9 copies)
MSIVMEEKKESRLKQVQDKRFANKKFFGHNFSGMDLTNADFRDTTLIECNFRDSDLSHAVFKGANCYGSDFTDTVMRWTTFERAVLAKTKFAPKQMFGITITLTCDSFDEMEISRTALLYWMFIPTLMKAPEKEMADRVIAAIGEEAYKALSRVFKEQIVT